MSTLLDPLTPNPLLDLSTPPSIPVNSLILEVTDGISDNINRVSLKSAFLQYGSVDVCWIPPFNQRLETLASVQHLSEDEKRVSKELSASFAYIKFSSKEGAKAAFEACQRGECVLQGSRVMVRYRPLLGDWGGSSLDKQNGNTRNYSNDRNINDINRNYNRRERQIYKDNIKSKQMKDSSYDNRGRKESNFTNNYDRKDLHNDRDTRGRNFHSNSNYDRRTNQTNRQYSRDVSRDRYNLRDDQRRGSYYYDRRQYGITKDRLDSLRNSQQSQLSSNFKNNHSIINQKLNGDHSVRNKYRESDRSQIISNRQKWEIVDDDNDDDGTNVDDTKQQSKKTKQDKARRRSRISSKNDSISPARSSKSVKSRASRAKSKDSNKSKKSNKSDNKSLSLSKSRSLSLSRDNEFNLSYRTSSEEDNNIIDDGFNGSNINDNNTTVSGLVIESENFEKRKGMNDIQRKDRKRRRDSSDRARNKKDQYESKKKSKRAKKLDQILIDQPIIGVDETKNGLDNEEVDIKEEVQVQPVEEDEVDLGDLLQEEQDSQQKGSADLEGDTGVKANGTSTIKSTDGNFKNEFSQSNSKSSSIGIYKMNEEELKQYHADLDKFNQQLIQDNLDSSSQNSQNDSKNRKSSGTSNCNKSDRRTFNDKNNSETTKSTNTANSIVGNNSKPNKPRHSTISISSSRDRHVLSIASLKKEGRQQGQQQQSDINLSRQAPVKINSEDDKSDSEDDDDHHDDDIVTKRGPQKVDNNTNSSSTLSQTGPSSSVVLKSNSNSDGKSSSDIEENHNHDDDVNVDIDHNDYQESESYHSTDSQSEVIVRPRDVKSKSKPKTKKPDKNKTGKSEVVLLRRAPLVMSEGEGEEEEGEKEAEKNEDEPKLIQQVTRSAVLDTISGKLADKKKKNLQAKNHVDESEKTVTNLETVNQKEYESVTIIVTKLLGPSRSLGINLKNTNLQIKQFDIPDAERQFGWKVGDRIKEINGKEVNNIEELTKEVVVAKKKDISIYKPIKFVVKREIEYSCL